MLKKWISLTLVSVVLLGLFTGCNPSSGEKNMRASGDKIQIVTTIFPEYDWVMNVVGENSDAVEVTLLLDNGTDLHSYQPTPEDIIKISTCDMFVYVGGESDAWVDDVLKNAANDDMTVINLLDVLGDSVKEEEIVEGMEAEEEEEDTEEGPEYDEHVWLSLKNAAVLVENISDALQKLDALNADAYQKNAEDYTEKINALDAQYAEAVSDAKLNTLLFGDRFPFRYLIDDYDLNYYAAFVGCSAETEASFETIAFLAQKTEELSLPAVLIIEGSDGELAKTIVNSTATKDQKILILDSMQSVTSKDIKNGTTYLSVMEKNLSVLEEALN